MIEIVRRYSCKVPVVRVIFY